MSIQSRGPGGGGTTARTGGHSSGAVFASPASSAYRDPGTDYLDYLDRSSPTGTNGGGGGGGVAVDVGGGHPQHRLPATADASQYQQPVPPANPMWHHGASIQNRHQKQQSQMSGGGPSPSQSTLPIHTPAEFTSYSSMHDFTLQGARENSQEEQMIENEYWKPSVFYWYRGVSPLNWLHVMTWIGMIWAIVVSFVCWLWLVGGISLGNDSREAWTIAGSLITLVWFVLQVTLALVYIMQHQWLTYRHTLTVLMPTFVIFCFLLLGFIALWLSNDKYTNIRDFNNGHKTDEEKEKDKLALSSDKHWCDDEKIKAGLSFYVALAWLSLVAFMALPSFVGAYTAHKWPECNSDVTGFFKVTRDSRAAMEASSGDMSSGGFGYDRHLV